MSMCLYIYIYIYNIGIRVYVMYAYRTMGVFGLAPPLVFFIYLSIYMNTFTVK